MAVQYKAVSCIPPLYLVLYCLTPAEFGRYSNLNLCPPFPAWGETNYCARLNCNKPDGRGIRLVNRRTLYENPHFWQKRPEVAPTVPGHWQLAADHWPLELMIC